MSKLTLAGIQFCAGKTAADNLAYLETRLDQAMSSPNRPDVIVLPENFSCYAGDYRAVAEQGRLPQWLSHQAQRCGVYLVGGSVPVLSRDADNTAELKSGNQVPPPKVRTSCLVYSPDGELSARYDKLHLFDADIEDSLGRYRESDRFEAGDAPCTVEIEGVTFGLEICYDLRFPMQAQYLTAQGAQCILVPAAFTRHTGQAHWQVLLRARAIENGCYIFGVNQCGEHDQQRASYGHSMLVDPWGRVTEQLDCEAGIIIAQLDTDLIDAIRKQIPVHQHQRFATAMKEQH